MIGKTVSHYRIVEKLGEGGMGVVFKAQDLKLDRFVALKFLPRDLDADGDSKTRFIHEAKSASSLDHPNICTIHEIDETPDGRTFIVMPCYEGESLKERLRNGPLEIVEAVKIVQQVAAGLARAHEKGIVHRDIKPGNILVTKDGQVKLVDFGVAKLTGQTTVTKTGMRVGTVGYMSPQQALGEPLDARSDVFSLAVVLYELVADNLPFRGEQEAAMLYSIVHEDPQPLSAHRSDVPETLEYILEKALQKDVENRYQNATEFMFDLDLLCEELTAGDPARVAGLRRQRRRLARRRGVVALAATALVLVAVVVTRPVWQPRLFSPPREHALAVVDFRDLSARDDPTISAGMTNLVQTLLIEAGLVRVISQVYLHDIRRRLFNTTRGPIGEGQALEVAREAGATMLLSGQIGVMGDAPYVTWSLVDVASGESIDAKRVVGENAVLLADKIVADLLPLVGERSGVDGPESLPSSGELTTESPEAYRHYISGILAREEMRSGDAVRELENAVRLDSTFALAYFELSRTQNMELARDLAGDYADRAWELKTKLGVKDRMLLEAWRERIKGNDANAMDTYREALVRWPNDREVLSDFSLMLFYKWYFDEAVEVTKQAFTFYPDDPDFGLYYGASLTYTGRLEEALEAARVYARRLPDNPNAWDELGLRFLALGMPDSADAAFHRTLEVDPDFYYLWSQRSLAYSDYCRGETDRAIEKLQHVLKRNDLSPADSVEILTDVTYWPGIALLHAERGRFQEALGLFEETRRNVSIPETEVEVEGRIQLLLRIGRAREAMELTEALAKSTDNVFHQLSAEHYRIRALVALDSLEAARSAAGRLIALEEEGGAPEPFLLYRVKTDIALAEGDHKAALSALDEMARHGLPLGGLHDIERKESLAQALHMAGRSNDAVSELKGLLKVYGSHAVAHYRLGRIYEDMGRKDDAAGEYATFLDSWSTADPGLVELVDARKRLEALSARP